jgi:uncharacterized protein YcfJ
MLISFTLVVGLLFSANAIAGHYNYSSQDRLVRVIQVEPVIQNIHTSHPTTVRNCTNVYHQGGNTGGTILGAIAGAALGNQIGGGSGRDIATAAGAVIGGRIGNNYPRHSSNCYYTNSYHNSVRQQFSHYNVHVLDDDQVLIIRMQNNPPPVGSYIRF